MRALSTSFGANFRTTLAEDFGVLLGRPFPGSLELTRLPPNSPQGMARKGVGCRRSLVTGPGEIAQLRKVH